MKRSSPFSGMDPYLEHPAWWRDFHARFITYWCDWLRDHLPDHYSVRIDERTTLTREEPPGQQKKHMLPDVLVSQTHPLPQQIVSETSLATLDREPVTLNLKYAEEETETYLRILHRPDASLITVLELLSPTNKDGAGGQLYLKKRNELICDTVHLVELDLLLGGARLPVEGSLPKGDYYAFVSRGDQRPKCEVYHWELHEPLPRIRIPLKLPDPDVVFDLSGLFAFAHQRGYYAHELPYTKEPPPVALPQAKAVWVKTRIDEWNKEERKG